MNKELNVVGLDCANCALTLEKYVAKIEGVISCNINFSTSKMFLEIADEKYKSILKEIYKTAKIVNPDVKITENKQNDTNIKVYDILLYIIGILLGIIVIFGKLNYIAYYILLIISALFLGYRTYYKAFLQIIHLKLNENLLITISVIGACVIGESTEGIMVIALYTLGKMLEARAVNYSRKSISALINTQPEYATILCSGKEKKVKPESVHIGDILIVKPGEKVALDGVIIEGNANIDKKHLTGESVPVSVKIDDDIASGSIVLDSNLMIKVTNEYKDSTVSKILNLVSNASNKKSKTESFIAKFSSYYTICVIALSIMVWGITWLVLKDLNTAIYRGLIFLVVSCPCAFAISVPLSYFSGIGRCSKQGILIKGSNYLDACANLNKILFDKTGTITTGDFQVVKIDTIGKITKSHLLQIVVAGEQNSLHPIAKAICNYYNKKVNIKISNFKEISGKGISFSIKSNQYMVGRSLNAKGYTQVDVTKNDKLIGIIYLSDKIKDNANQAIKDINDLKIDTMILSGDNNIITKKVCKAVGIKEYKSELLPEDKFKIVECEKNKENKTIAFVGDGLNDAPALQLSDVGISMGIKGSQATIESSDVVIADDNLNQIPKLIKISKFTKKIVIQNIIFAGLTKFIFLLLGSLGITGMVFFFFSDVGVTLLAILNSLRVLTYKK